MDGECENAYIIYLESLMRQDHLGDIGLDRMIILK
jgi:hypothetical protein